MSFLILFCIAIELKQSFSLSFMDIPVSEPFCKGNKLCGYISKYFSDYSDDWPETSGIIEAKNSSSHGQQHEQSNQQAVSRVFLGLIFFGWYNITFFRFCGRVVHVYRVSDRFYLSACPHGFCFCRYPRNDNGLAVDRVMGHVGGCLPVCNGGIVNKYGLRLPLILRCRLFRCLRFPRCRAAQQEEKHHKNGEQLCMLFHCFHKQEFFLLFLGKF